MPPHLLSRLDARRIAVRAQLIDDDRPVDLLDTVRHLDRARMADIFDVDDQLEMYKPAAQRRFGYFALSVLDGEDLVGALDATADRTAGVFRVHAVHRDTGWDDATADAVDAEIVALADWLDLPIVH